MTSTSVGLLRRRSISFVTRSAITVLYCVVAFLFVQAMLQPQCAGVHDEAVTAVLQTGGIHDVAVAAVLQTGDVLHEAAVAVMQTDGVHGGAVAAVMQTDRVHRAMAAVMQTGGIHDEAAVVQTNDAHEEDMAAVVQTGDVHKAAEAAVIQTVAVDRHTVDWVYGNARGLRQGCGEFRKAVSVNKPTFFAVNETHLDGDPSKPFVPHDYKVLCRLDRSMHGGGLLLGGRKHLLVDVLDLRKYNVIGVVEMVGIEWEGIHWILYYTPNSIAALELIDTMQRYKKDNPQGHCVFIGDANVHNADWIHSNFTDLAGELAQEFCEMFGMQQLINFPTRGENTLDLVMSDIDGTARELPGFGNSDHVAMALSFKMDGQMPPTPIKHQVQNWYNAPWNHIKGALKREFKDWTPQGTVDEAEADFDKRINDIILKYVKWKKPATPGPTPWWDKQCEMAYVHKCQCFDARVGAPEAYKIAIKRARRVQRRAYGKYQAKIKNKLANSGNGDTDFWQACKEIAGLDCEKGAATPDPQECADHFAEKMSNGKEIEFDEDFIPKDSFKVKISSFKIRRKNVLKSLKKMDPRKSANGVSPCFWKECADIMESHVTKLFKHIVKHAEYVYRWKTGRVTALHKRKSVKEPSNYRPLKVLENISVCFEDTISDQLYKWIEKFIPESQFGFLREVGTDDYGCTITFKMQMCLNKRGEGILISLDVKGAFDRVWWGRLKARLKAKGMRGRALRLMKHYLYERFLKVVSRSSSSTRRQIFSGVPQGAKWSPFLWNFDISEMPEAVSDGADVICYADDSGLWYEITKENKACLIGTINDDLQALVEWGKDNKTTFEASKNLAMVVSRKRKPFDISGARMSGLRMDGHPVEVVEEMRLVGFWFDSKLTFGGMVKRLAKKARSRVGALRRLKPMLNPENLKTMYTSFVRSVMKFGSLAYMSAADSHLERLDRIQESVSSFCGFEIESLESRREAAAIAMAFKMLDGKARGDLNLFKPEFGEPLSLTKKRARSDYEEGTQLKSLIRAHTCLR